MYPLDWVERLKWTVRGAGGPVLPIRGRVSPVVWSLGLVSLLTDLSTEMVSSVLPVYLVLHLHLSPLQFGVIDGVYNGLSVALIAMIAGFVADRSARYKQVAAFGYALSALCKLGLLAAAGAWGAVMGLVGLDRLGKGIRTAPRDSIISFHASAGGLSTAFGVHRALDAAGALLGPLVAFALLFHIPGVFDLLWIVSFIVACVGVAALWLFVPAVQPVAREVARPSEWAASLLTARFARLGFCGTVLALLTVSDAFVYLMLQERTQVPGGFLPLFYVGTATAYALFAVPAGLLADRYGRARVFASGYIVLVMLYGFLLISPEISAPLVIGSLGMMGLYYASTEGVLVAFASAIVPPTARTTGLALLATSIGLGKLLSSLAFGWMWQVYGATNAIAAFAIAMALALMFVVPRLGALERSE